MKDNIEEIIQILKENENESSFSGTNNLDYILIKLSVCMKIEYRIKLLESINEVIDDYNEKLRIISFMYKEKEKVKKKYSGESLLDFVLEEIDEKIKEVENEKKMLKEILKESNIVLAKFTEKNITVEKLRRVKKFIESDCGVEFNKLHLNVLFNIPDSSEEELEEFKSFVNLYHKRIEEEKIKAEETRQKNKALREARKKEIIKQISKSKMQEPLVNEDFTVLDKEIEVIKEHVPNQKSHLLFTNFLNGNSFEDIKSLFPKFEDESYYAIKNDLITMVTEEINSLYSIMEENENSGENSDNTHRYEHYLEQICEYFDNEEQIKDENFSLDTKKVNLFYSITPTGNCYVLDDLEHFDIELKKSFLKLLKRLQEARFTTNPTQQKKLTNNNSLVGVFELKRYNIRLIYKHLGGNNYYVMQAHRKNDATEREITEHVVIRNRKCYNHFKYIQSNLDNPELIDQLLLESDRITGIIEESARRK